MKTQNFGLGRISDVLGFLHTLDSRSHCYRFSSQRDQFSCFPSTYIQNLDSIDTGKDLAFWGLEK